MGGTDIFNVQPSRQNLDETDHGFKYESLQFGPNVRPLGMRRQDWRWNDILSKENREYAQIHLRPRDMLKLGILHAKGGMWQGKGVLHPHRFDQRSPLSV